jgi:hypothetical protein
MATTTNYSWTTPDDTDLVKDGAAAIRTLGSSADTTVKDLNPGTTAGDIDYYTSSTAKARKLLLERLDKFCKSIWCNCSRSGLLQLIKRL